MTFCCELLASVLADIHGALETSDSNMSRDVIEEMVFNAKYLGVESTPTSIC